MSNIKIPVYQPSLEGNEKKYVQQCLDTTWISSKGEFISKFETKFAEKIGIKYAAAVSNGTTALHLAIIALGIGKDDEVIVPTLTYIASVNSIAYTGAKPIFVDSQKNTWQIDPQDIERKISSKTKAIMVVHLYGQPCDMDPIMEIAKKHNIYVIEDCAEAFGTLYKGKHVGTFGNVGTFSFFGNKTITTGEGGMVITDDEKLYKKMTHLKGQGLADNREYWHDVIGYNYRMTNICAAIGLAQLEQADKFIAKKREIAKWYQTDLKDIPIIFQPETNGSFSSYWMCCILAKNESQRDSLRDFLKNHGIETRPLFSPVHSMPMYYSPNDNDYPIAIDLSQRGINLPSYPSLKKSDITRIASIIKNFFKRT